MREKKFKENTIILKKIYIYITIIHLDYHDKHNKKVEFAIIYQFTVF